jgi:hypothetical protein
LMLVIECITLTHVIHYNNYIATYHVMKIFQAFSSLLNFANSSKVTRLRGGGRR